MEPAAATARVRPPAKARVAGERPRVLVFTNLYPNAAQVRHGVFVETRTRKLAETGEVEVQVVAPVPWFPSSNPRFGRYATFARVPAREVRYGIPVHHPRYPVLPRVGMSVAPLLMAAALIPALSRVRAAGFDFDAIDAHFFYPDGVAAVILGRWFGRPVSVTARGSDLNLYLDFAVPGAWIEWAAARAGALATVSEALRARLLERGVDPARVVTLRNGVDASLFGPSGRDATRRRLGLDGFVVIAVGNLVPEKRFELALRALGEIGDATLLIVGDGPERARLAGLADALGMGARVRFHPVVAQDQLPALYSAADLLVLTSEREGWPNVLLEAMACGTPVASVPVGGVPEIVRDPCAGTIADEDGVTAVAAAIRAVRERGTDRSAVREYALGFDWSETTRAQLRQLSGMLGSRAGGAADAARRAR